MPDIGDYKGVPVIEVLVKDGDSVEKDAPLMVLESDKATMEVPSPAAGVVRGLRSSRPTTRFRRAIWFANWKPPVQRPPQAPSPQRARQLRRKSTVKPAEKAPLMVDAALKCCRCSRADEHEGRRLCWSGHTQVRTRTRR